MKYKSEGKHLLLDLKKCENLKILASKKNCKIFLEQLALIIGATPLGFLFHKFKPVGETAVLLLSESHISIHTYPETGSVFIDIFTCGNLKPGRGYSFVEKSLQPKTIESMEIKRKG